MLEIIKNEEFSSYQFWCKRHKSSNAHNNKIVFGENKVKEKN
jgi:hypothetical protein